MRFLTGFFILFSVAASAQCKTYRIGAKGDTLNCTDFNNLRQGKWVVHIDELRGEPGFEEEGVYRNGKKDGSWHRFTLMGDLTAIEYYRWGNKDGVQRYFSGGSIEHEESWKAFDPEKKFDTIDVPDLYDPYKYDRKVIKIDAYSMKNGEWKYYDPSTMMLTKTETYVFDKLQGSPLAAAAPKPVAAAVDPEDSTKKAAKPKPKEIAEFEKKNSNKKKVKMRDGKTGG